MATTDDGPQIGNLHALSQRVTYEPYLSRQALRRISETRLQEVWARRLVDSSAVVLVSEVGAGEVAGFGMLRLDSYPWSTLVALHVHPFWHAQGIGSALLTALRQLAVDRSRPHMQLSVLKANVTARRFYERRGFRERGTAPVHTIGGQRVAVLRYVFASDAAHSLTARSHPDV